MAAGAVGVEIELLLLDPVLHVAAGAVGSVIERLPVTFKRGEDKPGVCSHVRVFGLDDDAAFAIPGCRRIFELSKQTLLLPGLFVGRFGLLDERGSKLLETGIPPDAHDVVDPVRFAPAKHFPATETAVAPEDDFHIRPALAYPLAQQGEDRPRMLRPIYFRGAQVGAEQVGAAEDIERQEAVVVVVAMEKPAILISVHRIVGCIEVEYDLFWWHGMRSNEAIDEQGVHLNCGLALCNILEAAERRGACQRPIATDRCLQGDIMPKFIVVVEILFAASNGIDALAKHLLEGMAHARLATGVGNGSGGGAGQSQFFIRLPQQQNSAVGGDVPSRKIDGDLSGFTGWKTKIRLCTFCHSVFPVFSIARDCIIAVNRKNASSFMKYSG